jgi:PleD family two-component response regulator
MFKKTEKIAVIERIHTSQSFHHLIDLERGRVNREGHEFSLVLFRITDKAKSEKILNRMGRTISKRIRKIDQIGRYDENHFGLLLPYTPLYGARKIAKELCSDQNIGMFIMDCDFYVYPEIAKRRTT